MFSDIIDTEKQLWKEEWKDNEELLKKQQATLKITKFTPKQLKSKRFSDMYDNLFIKKTPCKKQKK